MSPSPDQNQISYYGRYRGGEVSLFQHHCIQFFINCMCDATHNKSFGLVSTAINEVRKRIYSIPDDIFGFFYQYLSDFYIEALTRYKKLTG